MATGSRPIPDQSVLSRLKNNEPARLYCYGFGSLLIIGLVARGLVSGDYLEDALWALGVALGVVGSAESTRASVFSPDTHLATMLRARAAWSSATGVLGPSRLLAEAARRDRLEDVV